MTVLLTAVCFTACMGGQASGSRDPRPPGSALSCPREDEAQQAPPDQGTCSGNHEEQAGTEVPQREGQGAGDPVELGIDLWRIIWDKLSVTELARLAIVAKEWREAWLERAAKRRAAALARVTAPDNVPDGELLAPQLIFRAIRRHLLGQGAFTGEPVGGPRDKGAINRCELAKGEIDSRPPELLEYLYQSGSLGLFMDDAFSREPAIDFFMRWKKPVSPDDPNSAPAPLQVIFELRPRCPDECEWMQGLLLALSDGSLGEPCPRGDRGACFPQLRGLLARSTSLKVEWSGYMHESKDFVLLPMFDHVEWESRPVYGDEIWPWDCDEHEDEKLVRAVLRWTRGVNDLS